ncbi:MAG: DUF885 family protein [Burkholderiales bacterium]|nr:MAG: DUF885 family protein [Burkholderiales bacterium]
MKLLILAAVLAALAGCANISNTSGELTTDERFRAIYESEWAWRNTYDPQWDDATPDDKLPKSWGRVDVASQDEQLAYMQGVVAKLDALDAGSLSPEGQINLAIYRDQIDVRMARITYREYEKPLNADSTFWGNVAGATPKAFRNEAQALSWIALLNDIPRFFDDETANMKLGLARGFTPPRVTLQGRAESISAIYANKTPEQSQFYEPFNSLPSNIPAERRAMLQAEAKAVIAEKVFPAYRSFLPYFRDEYLPRTATDIAATKMPDGGAYYAAQIREFTTLKKSPEDIHQIGLAEVAKIKARMLDVMKEAGFTGDLPAFLTFLRTDPQFYAKTPDELLMRAAWISKKFDGKAKYFFGRLPRSRFDVIPVPDDIAPFYTAGRGGTGVYLVNTYNLPSRALYSLPALTLHESAPGHAFQMPLADEQEGVPDFRRKTYISAFGEGWALYCELLGEEMGMYQTPYETFGMLSYQMWRAARLVVDTGIHAKGWTREQGQDFFRENTALAEHEITTEVDRYISWPGQALSYYLGQMAIVEGRKRAETALGAKFDIRNFHDTVLQLGSVPLPVLDARIDRFIAEGGPDPYAETLAK